MSIKGELNLKLVKKTKSSGIRHSEWSTCHCQ